MKYGRHIDNAYMSSGRADLSFTVFLNCKKKYEFFISLNNKQIHFMLNEFKIDNN